MRLWKDRDGDISKATILVGGVPLVLDKNSSKHHPKECVILRVILYRTVQYLGQGYNDQSIYTPVETRSRPPFRMGECQHSSSSIRNLY